MELPRLFGPHRESLERLVRPQPGSREEQRKRVENALAAEISGVESADTLLVSSEILFGASPAAIDDYKRLFAPYADRFESLMYVRRQDRWIASSVLQRRRTGTRLDTRLDARFGAMSAEGFERAVRLWDAASDRCHIRRFDTAFLLGGSLLGDFCGAIGFNGVGLFSDDLHNRAVLQEQLELVDTLNQALAALPFDKQMAYRRRFLPLCTEVIGGHPFEFPRAAAEATFKAFASVNTWLRETRDPTGPAFFFDEDFSDYPTLANNERIYTIEQLFELSAFLGQRLRERGLPAPEGPDDGERAGLMARIVSSFIDLHDAATEQARETRRIALIEERRRERIAERTAIASPDRSKGRS